MEETDYIGGFIVVVKIIGVLVTALAGLLAITSSKIETKAEANVSESDLEEILKRLRVRRKGFRRIAIASVIITVLAQIADLYHEAQESKAKEAQMANLLTSTTNELKKTEVLILNATNQLGLTAKALDRSGQQLSNSILQIQKADEILSGAQTQLNLATYSLLQIQQIRTRIQEIRIKAVFELPTNNVEIKNLIHELQTYADSHNIETNPSVLYRKLLSQTNKVESSINIFRGILNIDLDKIFFRYEDLKEMPTIQKCFYPLKTLSQVSLVTINKTPSKRQNPSVITYESNEEFRKGDFSSINHGTNRDSILLYNLRTHQLFLSTETFESNERKWSGFLGLSDFGGSQLILRFIITFKDDKLSKQIIPETRLVWANFTTGSYPIGLDHFNFHNVLSTNDLGNGSLVYIYDTILPDENKIVKGEAWIKPPFDY